MKAEKNILSIAENNKRGLECQERLRKQRENWTQQQWKEFAFTQQARNNKILGKPNAWETWKGWQKKGACGLKMHKTLIFPKILSEGKENEVYNSLDGENVIKFNNLSTSDSMGHFVDRIKAHNKFERKAPYEILGVGQSPKGGSASVVLRQPFIDGVPAPIETIMLFLKQNGFELSVLNNGVQGFCNDEFEISDLWKNDGSMKSDNVLLDEDGSLVFIDADIHHRDFVVRNEVSNA